jgi:HSP20 family protein
LRVSNPERPVLDKEFLKMNSALRATNPFSSLGSLNRLDSLFDHLIRGDGDAQRGGFVWRPLPLSVWQDDKAIFLEAELPGVLEQEVDITVHEGVLTIKAERKDAEGREYLHKGRSFGRFEQAITLPEQVDSEKVVASLTNGVLRIELPKVPQAQPRKIALKTS